MRAPPLTKTWIMVAAIASLGGCISDSPRGYPLYPSASPPQDPSQVVRLLGYVRYVDGVDVTEHGTSFELLPGCHVVVTPSHWGSVSDGSGGVVATTGERTFALPMKPGYQYAVAVELKMGAGPSGSLRVVAYEHDAAGATTHTFAPAESDDDIRECKATMR